MAATIVVRNVPEAIHRGLKARAALAGISLSDYVLTELRRGLDCLTTDEVLARIATREPCHLTESVAAAIRAERESR
jgi:plasmid stability protein